MLRKEVCFLSLFLNVLFVLQKRKKEKKEWKAFKYRKTKTKKNNILPTQENPPQPPQSSSPALTPAWSISSPMHLSSSSILPPISSIRPIMVDDIWVKRDCIWVRRVCTKFVRSSVVRGVCFFVCVGCVFCFILNFFFFFF